MSWLAVQCCRSKHVLGKITCQQGLKHVVFWKQLSVTVTDNPFELVMPTFCGGFFFFILCNSHSSLKIDVYEFFHGEKITFCLQTTTRIFFLSGVASLAIVSVSSCLAFSGMGS